MLNRPPEYWLKPINGKEHYDGFVAAGPVSELTLEVNRFGEMLSKHLQSETKNIDRKEEFFAKTILPVYNPWKE